ncbi:MAG: caspase family protein [Pirellulales bacterium]
MANEPTLRPPKLYVVLLIDTDSNLAADVAKDRDNLQRILSEAFATRPHRFEVTVLQGRQATREQVLATLNALRGKVRENDSVFVYYSGHGATLLNDGGHALTLHHDQRTQSRFLLRSEVLEAMRSSSPRLRVLLTDCCSKIPEQLRGRLLPAAPKATWPVMDTLFFQHQGLTDINGCQPNAFSWSYWDADGPKGGTFTLALVPLLCTKRDDINPVFGVSDGIVNWRTFTNPLKRDTDRHYQSLRQALLADPLIAESEKSAMRDQLEQTPEVFSLATLAPQPIVDNAWMLGIEHTSAVENGKPVVYIVRVYPNTPAETAGLRQGDTVVSINDIRVNDREQLARLIDYSDGRIRLCCRRNGEQKSFDIPLKPVKPAPVAPPAPAISR